MKGCFYIFFSLIPFLNSIAQEIQMTETASLEQVYGSSVKSTTLLPMNALNVDVGYILYQANIKIESENASLDVQNVRDYASVYINEELQGVITDNQKKITLPAKPGDYSIRLYAENIGRITYGPEILDNSKGLFGDIYLNGKSIENWKITELKIRNVSVANLKYTETSSKIPCFHKGYFTVESPKDIHLDISGWGMGEAWINGQYVGSYWETEKQKSLQIPATALKKGINEVVVFELKNNEQKILRLSDAPIFR